MQILALCYFPISLSPFTTFTKFVKLELAVKLSLALLCCLGLEQSLSFTVWGSAASLSSQSMHLGVLAMAAHAVTNQTLFLSRFKHAALVRLFRHHFEPISMARSCSLNKGPQCAVRKIASCAQNAVLAGPCCTVLSYALLLSIG
ncbi:hypothetical protein V6N13_003058 [Hibiscus sabdariffa]